MNPHIKRFSTHLLLGLAMAVSLNVSAREITDGSGQQVQLPDSKITRVADGWFAHSSLMMTLGLGDTLVATVNHPRSRPWMFKLQPSLDNALLAQGKLFNGEELVNRGVQLAFLMTGDPQAAGLERLGIPVVQVHFTTLPGLQKALTLTAKAMGEDNAVKRAASYNQYLQHQLSRITAKTDKLPDSKRPSVVHIFSFNPLKVDGQDTLIDNWIHIAGGKNAATVKGTMQQVSAEQLLSWQPDVVIIGATAGKLQNSPDAALLSQLKAVKQGHVLYNPSGVFPWDRYGTESALQIQWAAKALHPELFSQDKMVPITRDFYREFFQYPLTQVQAERILKGLPPETM
ncbi:ABC transporter substrate-binding protein [Shewanella sp. NFH-SH190041]|uniref:ABC transporter substrate-binding protein n=1 Tax=Shewanella sp. NFH-SH190041 TaxID=2950245 RepID=UPI0021C372E9|nr:ABC transporter substrate-binding protein [Shewanella sp. NFH-SH190041]BDM65864.1 ABC transporter substrate-binding protein [Shewanella sp. NFH-SH190041]